MEPYPWVVTHSTSIKTGGAVLDLACGGGRHTRYLLEQGFFVMALDINLDGISDILEHPNLAVLEADLENGYWPLGNAQFDGIIVTNYLHRPLFPHIMAALAPNGVLIYETFMIGNEAYGRPANPDFLLAENELQDVCQGLDIQAFEQGYEDQPKPAMKQKIVAVNRH
jgi:SAM-dependent methyltransferase